MDVGDVAIHRLGRNQEFVTKRRFNAMSIDRAIGTIPLHASARSRNTGSFVTCKRIFDGKGIVAFAACRDKPRHVVTCRCRSLLVAVHESNNSSCERQGSAYPHRGGEML